MIETGMRVYPLWLIPEDKDRYGERVEPVEDGTARLSISLYAQSVADNVNYKDCQYIGPYKRPDYNRIPSDPVRE